MGSETSIESSSSRKRAWRSSSPTTVKQQWWKGGDAHSSRTPPESPRRRTASRVRLDRTQASSSPARTCASCASSAPPVSPCLPRSRSRRVATQSRSGSKPSARSACTGMMCACGESASPKPIRRPRRSESCRKPESSCVTSRLRQPRSVSRIASASAWPPVACSTCTCARLVFQAVSSRPASRSATWSS